MRCEGDKHQYEGAGSEPPPAPADADADDAFDAGSFAAGMAADRIREPRTALGLVLAALLVGFVIGRRSR